MDQISPENVTHRGEHLPHQSTQFSPPGYAICKAPSAGMVAKRLTRHSSSTILDPTRSKPVIAPPTEHLMSPTARSETRLDGKTQHEPSTASDTNATMSGGWPLEHADSASASTTILPYCPRNPPPTRRAPRNEAHSDERVEHSLERIRRTVEWVEARPSRPSPGCDPFPPRRPQPYTDPYFSDVEDERADHSVFNSMFIAVAYQQEEDVSSQPLRDRQGDVIMKDAGNVSTSTAKRAASSPVRRISTLARTAVAKALEEQVSQTGPSVAQAPLQPNSDTISFFRTLPKAHGRAPIPVSAMKEPTATSNKQDETGKSDASPVQSTKEANCSEKPEPKVSFASLSNPPTSSSPVASRLPTQYEPVRARTPRNDFPRESQLPGVLYAAVSQKPSPTLAPHPFPASYTAYSARNDPEEVLSSSDPPRTPVVHPLASVAVVSEPVHHRRNAVSMASGKSTTTKRENHPLASASAPIGLPPQHRNAISMASGQSTTTKCGNHPLSSAPALIELPRRRNAISIASGESSTTEHGSVVSLPSAGHANAESPTPERGAFVIANRAGHAHTPDDANPNSGLEARDQDGYEVNTPTSNYTKHLNKLYDTRTRRREYIRDTKAKMVKRLEAMRKEADWLAEATYSRDRVDGETRHKIMREQLEAAIHKTQSLSDAAAGMLAEYPNFSKRETIPDTATVYPITHQPKQGPASRPEVSRWSPYGIDEARTKSGQTCTDTRASLRSAPETVYPFRTPSPFLNTRPNTYRQITKKQESAREYTPDPTDLAMLTRRPVSQLKGQFRELDAYFEKRGKEKDAKWDAEKNKAAPKKQTTAAPEKKQRCTAVLKEETRLPRTTVSEEEQKETAMQKKGTVLPKEISVEEKEQKDMAALKKEAAFPKVTVQETETPKVTVHVTKDATTPIVGLHTAYVEGPAPGTEREHKVPSMFQERRIDRLCHPHPDLSTPSPVGQEQQEKERASPSQTGTPPALMVDVLLSTDSSNSNEDGEWTKVDDKDAVEDWEMVTKGGNRAGYFGF